MELDINMILAIAAGLYPVLMYILPKKYAQKLDIVRKILEATGNTPGGLRTKPKKEKTK